MKNRRTFSEAHDMFPELMQELLALEYVLTWGYTDNYERDNKRHIEIHKIIY